MNGGLHETNSALSSEEFGLFEDRPMTFSSKSLTIPSLFGQRLVGVGLTSCIKGPGAVSSV